MNNLTRKPKILLMPSKDAGEILNLKMLVREHFCDPKLSFYTSWLVKEKLPCFSEVALSLCDFSPPVPEIQLPLLDAHSADGASGPSAHSLYHHGNKMSRAPPCTDSHEDEEGDNNDESATSDSSDTTDFNDVSFSVETDDDSPSSSAAFLHWLCSLSLIHI